MPRSPDLGISLFTHVDPDRTLRAWSWEGTALVPCESLSIADRGFRYGMALFESLRVLGGRPLFLEEHLQRLGAAARQRRFPVDAGALAALGPCLRSHGADGFARIYLTAGEGSPTAPATRGRTLLLLEDRPPSEGEPLRLALSPEGHRPLFGGLKTANYWANLDALDQARQRGFGEALLFNEHAELISAATGNVFLVREGVIRTPALACGARDGVVRAWVLRQTPVQECSLFLQDVESASEIFVTNSWRGLTAASAVEYRTLPAPRISPRLAQAYAQAIA